MPSFHENRVPKWSLSNAAVFVDELPHTAIGKLQETKLRELFKDYRLANDAAFDAGGDNL